MPSSTETRPAEDLLKEARKTAIEAQNTQGSVPQSDKFKAALALYQRVNKRDPNSAAAAEALLEIGKILAGVPIQSSPRSASDVAAMKQVFRCSYPTTTWLVFPTTAYIQNDYTARDTFRTLLQRFDKNKNLTKEDFIKEYGPEQGSRIAEAVRQARIYEPYIGQRMDEKNRSDIRYKIVAALVAATGSVRGFSYWFAMVLLAVIVKIVITPLTKAQFKSMREMQRIQPLMKELQEKYKDNPREMNAKIMQLYKDHGVNPFSGCWPILVQMPILIVVYQMIRLFEYQFAKGTFLWIGFNPIVHKWAFPIMGKPVWLTAGSLAEPDLILLVLYTVSLILSQKMTVVDPSQAEQQRMMMFLMPVMFFFLIGYLPSAFIFYWFMFNVLQTWQQYHLMRAKQPEAPLTLAAATESEPALKPKQRSRNKSKK